MQQYLWVVMRGMSFLERFGGRGGCLSWKTKKINQGSVIPSMSSCFVFALLICWGVESEGEHKDYLPSIVHLKEDIRNIE